MKKIVVLIITLLILSCQNLPSSKTADLDVLFENYYQGTLELYRINATYQGDSRYNDTLPNFLSDEFKAKEKAFYTSYLNDLNQFEDSSLSEEALLSKNILKWECEMALQGMEFLKDQMPIDQMWGFQLTMGQLASGEGAQPFKTVTDYENWLIRIDGYLEWLDSAKQKM